MANNLEAQDKGNHKKNGSLRKIWQKIKIEWETQWLKKPSIKISPTVSNSIWWYKRYSPIICEYLEFP